MLLVLSILLICTVFTGAALHRKQTGASGTLAAETTEMVVNPAYVPADGQVGKAPYATLAADPISQPSVYSHLEHLSPPEVAGGEMLAHDLASTHDLVQRPRQYVYDLASPDGDVQPARQRPASAGNGYDVLKRDTGQSPNVARGALHAVAMLPNVLYEVADGDAEAPAGLTAEEGVYNSIYAPPAPQPEESRIYAVYASTADVGAPSIPRSPPDNPVTGYYEEIDRPFRGRTGTADLGFEGNVEAEA